MLNRTADLHIHAQPDLERIMSEQLKYFCAELPFKVIFHSFNPNHHSLIFEDKSINVYSIPLKHRVPCSGFLFEEKPRDRNIIKEMIDFYKIPTYLIPKIKKGEDFITNEGETISNHLLTNLPVEPKRYAYCSDTAYSEKIIPMIKGIDCLYHESTFMEDELVRAKQTLHSTAKQAAEIAKRAGVGKLILGHYSARYKDHESILMEAKSVFENTFLGEDMTVFEI